MRFLYLTVFLLFPILPACTQPNIQNKPPHPSGIYGYDANMPDLLNINGLTYHEARPIIMSVG